jgi:hypothetical protein
LTLNFKENGFKREFFHAKNITIVFLAKNYPKAKNIKNGVVQKNMSPGGDQTLDWSRPTLYNLPDRTVWNTTTHETFDQTF